MAKQISREKFYSPARILKFDASYYTIIGERSNGKTYSVKKICIDDSADYGGKFMYIRRRHEQIARKNMVKLFQDINEYAFDKYGGYINYTTESGFYYTKDAKDDPNKRVTVGYATSVEDCYTLKGVPFNEITTIFFDEFLEYGTPIEDEIARFVNVISTIVRKRDNVKIFMVANTVTKYSDYFTLLGIDPKKLKMGEIAYIKHNNGVSCAVEYCDSKNIIDGVKVGNKYLGFDNNTTADMILYGEWEYDAVNTKDIDGIGWSSNRRGIPMYMTALGQVFEMSLYVDPVNPVAFVRMINTQNGFVKQYIRYNLAYDDSLHLSNKNGIVPIHGKVTELIDDSTRKLLHLFNLALEAKRVVFDKMSTGSDFLKLYKKVK